MKKSSRTFHVISNTHWDREWRFPFQRNRQMLVDMIDKVIEILETEPEYRAFHLDSQSIVLKDYLEIKPQNTERIKKLVKADRLLIGPWYILPEEFQVGGENLIRNLLIGHRLCREMGGVSKIGYSPFSWGQISQLPQIYKEFGIELIMFYRGINALESPKAEFLWEGADGTEAVSSRFSTMPRYNFYFYIYRTAVHNEGFADVEYPWMKGGVPFHFADEKLSGEDYFLAKPADNYYPENIEPQVKKIIEDQADDFTTGNIIWMEGHDSSGPNIKTVQIIKDIKSRFPELNVVHSTLEEYAEALLKTVKKKDLSRVKGERRSAQYNRRSGNLYGYTTSARMYLKQKNFDAERWLQFYAEPLNVITGLLGRDNDDRYIDNAWELLVQNSAHDSIGGCSLDEIHDDMMNRYKHVIEISKGVYERGAKYLISQINMEPLGGGKEGIYLTFLNPTNYLRSEVCKLYVDIPAAIDKGGLEIIDGSFSTEIQVIKKRKVQPVLEEMTNRPMYLEMVRYEVYAHLKTIPGMGYKTVCIKPVKRTAGTTGNIAADEKGKIILRNEAVNVTINSNGTFNIKNIAGKVEYRNLGYIYDEGEAGHAWVNIPVKPFINTLKSAPKIKITENGPLSSRVKIEHIIELPKDLKSRKNKKGTVKVPVSVEISLQRGAKYAELYITADNRAESHRLRIMFPTNLKGSIFSYGEGQFDVPERGSERPDTKDWVEQPMYDYPMHNFAGVSNGEEGLTLLTDGLKEYELLNDKNSTLAVTLLRSFEYIIYPSSKEDYSYQKGSQCLGLQSFRLAVYPHKGSWNEAGAYKEALNFNNKISAVQSGAGQGELPSEKSFIKVEPESLIISTVKKPEDNSKKTMVVRIYNPALKPVTGTIKTAFKIQKAEKVNLEETEAVKLKADDYSVSFKAEPKKIITVKIEVNSSRRDYRRRK